MAALHVSTDGQMQQELEGYVDELKQLFVHNAHSLNEEWYETLKHHQVDMELLMASREENLKEMLTACELNVIAANKIIVAVAKLPESTIYKMRHAAVNAQISIVSTAEHEAAQKLKNEGIKLSNAVHHISSMIQQLSNNSHRVHAEIDRMCDQLVESVNERRTLLLQHLQHVTRSKQEQLAVHKTRLQQKAMQMDVGYAEAQAMMKDLSIDTVQRQNRIVCKAELLLQPESTLNVQPEIDIVQKKIAPDQEHQTIVEYVSRMGSIQTDKKVRGPNECVVLPRAPTIRVQNVMHNTAEVHIEAENDEKEPPCTAYRLQYGAVHNNNNKDAKNMQWKTVLLPRHPNLIYKLDMLKPPNTYAVRVQSQNRNGWGAFCKCANFETTFERSINDVAQFLLDWNLDKQHSAVVSKPPASVSISMAAQPHSVLLQSKRIINEGTYAPTESRETGWIVENISNQTLRVHAKLVKTSDDGDTKGDDNSSDKIIEIDMKSDGEHQILIQVDAPPIPSQYHLFYQLVLANDESVPLCDMLCIPVDVKPQLSKGKEDKIRTIFEMGFRDRYKIVLALEKWNWDVTKAINWLATH